MPLVCGILSTTALIFSRATAGAGAGTCAFATAGAGVVLGVDFGAFDFGARVFIDPEVISSKEEASFEVNIFEGGAVTGAGAAIDARGDLDTDLGFRSADELGTVFWIELEEFVLAFRISPLLICF